MKSRNSKVSIALHLSLVLSLSLGSSSAAFADLFTPQTGAPANNPVSGVANGLNSATQAMYQQQGMLYGVNQSFTDIRNSISGLVNGINGYNQANQSLPATVAGQLATAKASASQCSKKGATDIVSQMADMENKDTSSEDEGDSNAPTAVGPKANALIEADPTCENVADIIIAAKLTQSAILKANKDAVCLQQFQDKFNAALDATKTAFSELFSAAQDVFDKYQDLIDQYTSLAKDIDTRLNSKGGLVEQLNNLSAMSLALKDSLNRTMLTDITIGGENGTKLKVGLSKDLDNITHQKNNTGGAWYQTYTQNIWACMNNTPKPCVSNGQDLPPMACLALVVNQASGGRTGQNNIGQYDILSKNLGQSLLFNTASVSPPTSTANPSPTDTSPNLDPKLFLNFANAESLTLLGKLDKEFNRVPWYGGVSKDSVVTSFNTYFESCRMQAEAAFKLDIDKQGPTYFGIKDTLANHEKENFNETMKWINLLAQTMQQFRTSFYGQFDPALDQYASDCSKGSDAYKARACLQNLSSMLEKGISGINGEKPQTIPQTVVSVDASGNVTTSVQNFTCVGFKQCVDQMKQLQKSEEKNVQTQTKNQKMFVKTHVKNVRKQISDVNVVAQNATTDLLNGKESVNAQLSLVGVSASLTTTAMKGKDIEFDEKTAMPKAPESMKDAIAFAGGLQELQGVKEMQTAVIERGKHIDEKVAAAQKMKKQCAVVASDYAGLLSALGDCKDIDLSQIERSAGKLFKKAGSAIDTGSDANSIDSVLSNCASRLAKKHRNTTVPDVKAAAALDKKEDEDDLKIADKCAKTEGLGYLSGLVPSRKPFTNSDDKIMNGISKLIKDPSTCSDLRDTVTTAKKVADRNSKGSGGSSGRHKGTSGADTTE